MGINKARKRMQSFLLAGENQAAGCAVLQAFGYMNNFYGKRGHTVCYETASPLSKGQNMESQDYALLFPKSPSSSEQELWAVPWGPTSLVSMVETESGHLPSCRRGETLGEHMLVPE